jgi:hypothetical protein
MGLEGWFDQSNVISYRHFLLKSIDLSCALWLSAIDAQEKRSDSGASSSCWHKSVCVLLQVLARENKVFAYNKLCDFSELTTGGIAGCHQV